MLAMRLIACLLAAVTLAGPASAQERTLRSSTVATLTVLSAPVESARADAGPLVPAVSGSDLQVGDRVVTGPAGRALITFLDGSTVTVEPASDVTVRVAEMEGGDASRLRVLIMVGTVWARVAGWLAGRASLTLESNAYSATAHDGLIGAQQQPDGTFVCWTRAGGLEVTGTTGASVARIEPGQKVTLGPGRPAAVEGFAVNQSTLGVVTSGPVLPLVLMPDGRRVAGFVEPGIAVNQVFGSLTAGTAGSRTVEVPAGVSGPYVLILVAVGDGPFTVTVTGRYRGTETYRQEQAGEAHHRQGLRAEVIQTMSGGPDPRTARADRGGMSTLRPETTRPGTVVLSPLEVAAPRR